MQNIEDIQNILTAAIELIPALFLGMMAVDLIAGLVKLSHCSESKLSYQKQQRSPQQFSDPQSLDAPPAIYTQAAASILETKPLKQSTETQSHGTEQSTVDREALLLLIEKSKQATLRSAAKQLGIATRVNGRYQRLDYLGAQIQSLLKSQPYEVARVFSELTEQEAA